jgi:hypothetical protein
MKARCYQEFCGYEATFHIDKDNFGFCGGHHNVAYFWAGSPVKRKPEDCYSCKKEKVSA